MDTILKIEHLTKSLGKREILHDISFETYGGEVFGFLGPNGAGKTTTIKVLVGLLLLDQGTVSICGYDLKKDFENAIKNVGGIVENPEFYKYLSGYENLRQYAKIQGVGEDRIREVIHLVGLENRINDKVSKYSLGMRQRLGVALSLLHRPKLLILDEPTNGLDPAGIKELRDILTNLAHEENISVVVSSHQMSEMELMCDRVGVIVAGELKSVQPISELVASVAHDKCEKIFRVDAPERAAQILSENGFEDVTVTENSVNVLFDKASEDEITAKINRLLVHGDISVFNIADKENRRLEDVFIELTQREGGDQIV
ncbi:MAG: ABC transporter ATP-binding protein [Clostridia bacterium]|nr:ABC transporter ATP-binding protein [Clostridia bacterium]